MDPTGMSASAAIGGLITIGLAVVAWMKQRRTKREKIAQAEADELGKALVRADSGNDPPLKLRLGKEE